MENLSRRRRFPFAMGAAILAIVTLAVARLPESFINGLERSGPFSFSQATWIFRFFVVAAVAQGVYGGFRQFRPAAVQRALERDQKAAAYSKDRLIRVISRNAVIAALMPLVYGVILLGLTGLRGSFWVFPLLSLAQGAWYYRLVGDVSKWVARQAEPATPV